MKKDNKIIVAISADERAREAMIKRIIIDMGFAQTVTDAGKIIRGTPHDYDLQNSYFVFATSYNLRESPATTHRLTSMATAGIAIVIGVKKLYPEYEWICQPHYPSDFTR